MENIDFVIEVYVIPFKPAPLAKVFGLQPVKRLHYREIPVGTTVETYKRPPDFIFNGRFKPGYTLPLDHPARWYIQTFPKSEL